MAAGNRAQGVALLEVVHEAHAAAQHGAGAQEVGDHLLPADAAIPVGGGGAPQVGPAPGPPTNRPNPSHWEAPYQVKILTQLLIVDLDSWCRKDYASLGVRQMRGLLLTTCVVLGKSLAPTTSHPPGFLPPKNGDHNSCPGHFTDLGWTLTKRAVHLPTRSSAFVFQSELFGTPVGSPEN